MVIMMKTVKLFALFMIAALFCILPVTAQAAENVSYGKDTYASSKYTEDDSYAPQNVTNGNYNDIWSMGSVTLEGTLQGYQYVAVDLGGEYLIDSVTAVTRRGLNQPDARTGWLIQLANERNFSDAVTIGTVDTPSEYGEDYTFFSEYETPFRYVRVASSQYIVVAEVEVFGELYDPVTMKARPEFYDTEGKDYAPAAEVLSHLGIMEGISRHEFAGESLLTRAQAAKIITTFSNMYIQKSEGEIFSDVPKDHWATDYIYTAHKNGVISTDTKFRPNDYVTDTELLKMILYSMNYQEYIERNGGWPGGVYLTSNMLKLKKNISVINGEVLSRANAAKFLYNALRVPKFDNISITDGVAYYSEAEESTVEAVFDMKITEGLMSENSNTSLVREKENGSGYIKIGDTAYRDTSGKAELWIGRNIGVLTDKDDENRVLASWIIPNKNDIVTVYDSDRTGISKTQYEYLDENDSKKRILLDSNMYVIKNNSAITDWMSDDLICPDGYIEFTDNNDDGKMDVAFCYEPKVTAVNYISNIDGEITIVSLDGSTVSARDLNYLKITKNKKASTAGRIDKNGLVKIYLSGNGESLWIDSTYETLTGTVERQSGDSIIIDGRKIEFSEYYKNNRSKFDDIIFASPITVLLDDRGRLAWIPKNSMSMTGETYGFVTRLITDSGELDMAGARIFSQYGTFADYRFAQKVNIDGRSLSVGEIRDMIRDDKLDIRGSFVMFTTNANTEIDYLDTEYRGTEQNSKIVKMDVNLGTNKVNMPDTGGIYMHGYQLLPLRKDTLCFTVPWVNGTYGSKDYERYYRAETTEKAFPRLSQIKDEVAFYGPDANNYPTFAVKYKQYSAVSDSGVLEISDEFAPGLIFTELAYGTNEYDERTYVIKGLDIYTGDEKAYYTDEGLKNVYLADKIQHERTGWITDHKFIDPSKIDMSVVSDYIEPLSALKKGDIIRLQVEGGIAVGAERVFEANNGLNGKYDATSDGNWYSAGDAYPHYPSAAFRLVYGTAKAFSDNVFVMETCENKGVMQTENVIYDKLKYVFVVKDDGVIEKYYGSKLPSNVDIGDEVILYTREGPQTAVIVYK